MGSKEEIEVLKRERERKEDNGFGGRLGKKREERRVYDITCHASDAQRRKSSVNVYFSATCGFQQKNK